MSGWLKRRLIFCAGSNVIGVVQADQAYGPCFHFFMPFFIFDREACVRCHEGLGGGGRRSRREDEWEGDMHETAAQGVLPIWGSKIPGSPSVWICC